MRSVLGVGGGVMQEGAQGGGELTALALHVAAHSFQG